MMRFFLAMVLVVVMFSCSSESPETKFSKDGISLTCPKGWKVTGEEDIDGQGYYVTIERDGFNSSGLFIVTWVTGEYEREAYMEVYKSELQNNVIYKHSDLVFREDYEGTFSGIESVANDYTASVVGLDHDGVIHIFYGAGKTIAIMKQQATEDQKENADGFKALEESFAVATAEEVQ